MVFWFPIRRGRRGILTRNVVAGGIDPAAWRDAPEMFVVCETAAAGVVALGLQHQNPSAIDGFPGACSDGRRARIFSGSQRLFHALLGVVGKLCLRRFTDLFRKLVRDLAHIFELFRVAFAKGTHEIMDPQLDARRERQRPVHS